MNRELLELWKVGARVTNEDNEFGGWPGRVFETEYYKNEQDALARKEQLLTRPCPVSEGNTWGDEGGIIVYCEQVACFSRPNKKTITITLSARDFCRCVGRLPDNEQEFDRWARHYENYALEPIVAWDELFENDDEK